MGMSDRKCGIRPPDITAVLGYKSGCSGSCLRPHGHSKAHVIKGSDGKYHAWEEVYNCDCSADTECEHFAHRRLSNEEVERLLNGEK